MKQRQDEGRHEPRFLVFLALKVKSLPTDRLLASHRVLSSTPRDHCALTLARAAVLPSGAMTPWASRFVRFRSSIPSLQMPLSNASSAVLRPPSHGSGPRWFVTPSLYDSFIRYSKPVYPGAIHSAVPSARS